jgi:hypothetical protein
MNVHAAVSHGWWGIHFRNAHQCVDDLQSWIERATGGKS